jgi:hypothetical protein
LSCVENAIITNARHNDPIINNNETALRIGVEPSLGRSNIMIVSAASDLTSINQGRSASMFHGDVFDQPEMQPVYPNPNLHHQHQQQQIYKEYGDVIFVKTPTTGVEGWAV